LSSIILVLTKLSSAFRHPPEWLTEFRVTYCCINYYHVSP